MKKVLVAQLGARMHYSVPEILFRNDLLDMFYTDYYSGKFPFNLLPGGSNELIRKMNSRRSAVLPPEKVKHFPFFAIHSAMNLRKAKSVNDQMREFIRSGKIFSEKIIEALNGSSPGAIYGFNTACLELFDHAKERKSRLILEQTIAPYYIERQLLLPEEKKFPEWILNKESLDEHLVNVICEREREEMLLADKIVCGSSFVEESIGQFLPPVKNKINVVPYGVKSKIERRVKRFEGKRPLRILIAGTVGLRKGTPYVLEAARKLKGKAEFRMTGSVQLIPDPVRKELSSTLDLRGLVARTEMNEHYAWADAFLLPSICEGSATVTYEAMQHGLPLIVTPNTGSIIENEKQGFVIPPRNAGVIEESILKMCSPERLHYFAEQVQHLIWETTVEAYEKRLLKFLNTILQE